MALNTVQYFRNANQVSLIDYAATTSLADVFAADAVNLRDLTKLIVINTSASAVVLTIQESDGTNHRTVKVVTIPANAGNAAGIPAVDLLQDINYRLAGFKTDAFGNYFLRLPPTKKLRASAATGAVLIFVGTIESFLL